MRINHKLILLFCVLLPSVVLSSLCVFVFRHPVLLSFIFCILSDVFNMAILQNMSLLKRYVTVCYGANMSDGDR